MLNLLAALIAQYAAPAGAGTAASWLFARLRSSLPTPVPAPLDGAPSLAQRGYALLYFFVQSPMGAYASVVVLSGVVSIVAAIAVAALLGQDISVAAAAATGQVASQWRHVLVKNKLLPASEDGDAQPA